MINEIKEMSEENMKKLLEYQNENEKFRRMLNKHTGKKEESK